MAGLSPSSNTSDSTKHRMTDLKIWLSLVPGFTLAVLTGWYLFSGIIMAISVIAVLYFTAPKTDHDG